jgi:3-phosphoglycerate kinase
LGATTKPKSKIKTFDTVPGSLEIEDRWMGLGAGPKSIILYGQALGDAYRIVVNRPLRVSERPQFDAGTCTLFNLLKELTQDGALTVVGDGDTEAIVKQLAPPPPSSVSYLGMGGRAKLDLLVGDIILGEAASPTTWTCKKAKP